MQKATLARADSPDSPWKRVGQAQVYYQMSRRGVIEMAMKAKALAVEGKRQLIYCPRCDEYLLHTVRFDDAGDE